MDVPVGGVAAALASGVAFACYQMVIKRLHGAAPGGTGGPWAEAVAIPRLLGLLLPFWGAIGVAGWQSGLLHVNLAPGALLWPLGWACCTVLSTTGLVWLLGRFSLAEVAGYKKALITLGAVAVDWLLFGVGFPLLSLVAIALLLGGALGLSQVRKRLPRPAEWALIGLWCGVLLVQISLYKTGLQEQPQVLGHTVLAQGLAAALYALLWLSPAVRRWPLPPLKLVLLLWGCLVAGTLIEGFAYAALPLALVLVVTMLPAALLAGHDLWRGELPWQRRTWVALAALAAGFVVLVAG